jgi:formylglycine-generating enzyme required for sulfatase activity
MEIRPEGRAWYGQLDLVGSITEPVLDTYLGEFYGSAEAYGPDPANLRDLSGRVYRGAAFDSPPSFTRSTKRFEVDPIVLSTTLGVRCARTE